MRRRSLYSAMLILTVASVSGSAESGASGNITSGKIDPSPYSQIGLDQKLGARVDLSLPFRDEAGIPINLAHVASGKPILLVLSYYRCPMLCTYVLTGLAQGLDGISLQPGRDYRVAAVSIDPREGPSLATAKKKTYMARVGRDAGAAEGWRFLTGEQSSIAALAASVGFRYAYDKAAGEYAHPAAVIVLTPEGRVSRYFPGVEFPPRDLRLGLVEASQGKLGSISDRVFLACYRYNPVTGKYAPYLNGSLRALGAFLVLSLILSAVALERKGRKRARALARQAETQKTSAHA
ncbi:MAG: SCO family protein [Fibrobacteres bacterium]|nr:SCO family protein [Fibrobacterota bacterium]